MKSNSRRLTSLLALGGFVGLTVLLLNDHAVHVWRILPFLFLMACPLLHVFHHAGHSDNANPGTHKPDEPANSVRQGSKAPDLLREPVH
jgi:hypothetical protein